MCQPPGMRVQALLQTKQGLSPMQSWQNSLDKKNTAENRNQASCQARCRQNSAGMERPENRQYRRIRQEWASPPQGVPDRVVSVEAGGTQRTFFVFVENCGTTRSPDFAGNSRHQATVGGEAAVRQGENPCRPYPGGAWVA